MRISFISVTLLVLSLSTRVTAGLINLEDNFFVFMNDPVAFTNNGFTATIDEGLDGDPNPIILGNDPFFGDPLVIIPGPGLFLTFDFDFVEGPGSDDEFGAFIINPDTGFEFGAITGFASEFFTQDTSSGLIVFDLSLPALLAFPDSLGLQFSLTGLPFDPDFNSTVTISNVQIVPEPGTLAIFALGLGSLGVSRRKRSRKNLPTAR